MKHRKWSIAILPNQWCFISVYCFRRPGTCPLSVTFESNCSLFYNYVHSLPMTITSQASCLTDGDILACVNTNSYFFCKWCFRGSKYSNVAYWYKSKIAQRDPEEGGVLRRTAEGAGENISETEIHQQDRPEQASSWSQSQGVTGIVK